MHVRLGPAVRDKLRLRQLFLTRVCHQARAQPKAYREALVQLLERLHVCRIREEVFYLPLASAASFGLLSVSVAQPLTTETRSTRRLLTQPPQHKSRNHKPDKDDGAPDNNLANTHGH